MIASMIGRIEAGAGRGSRRTLSRFSSIVFALCCLSLGAFGSSSSPARAADYAGGPALTAPEGGVACSIGQPFWVPTGPTAETLPWPVVYYGHFSGGRPYADAYGRTIIDWRDEHVCFSTSAQCRAWVKASYRTHHQPEGYRGCLLLR